MARTSLLPFCASLATLTLAVVILYFPGLSGGYVFDDFPNIVDNNRLAVDSLKISDWVQAIFSKGGHTGRPLSMFTFAVERYFTGLNPFVMKATNVAIHIINGWLIFALIHRLASRFHNFRGYALTVSPLTMALLAALAWAVAPINLTGVLYVVQRMESLATLAMLAGLLAHLKGRIRLADGEPRALRWLWGGLAGGLAIGVLAKESAVMLPVYALVIESIFFGFGPARSAERRELIKLYLTLLVLPATAGGLLYITPRVLGPDAYSSREFTLIERLWTQPRVIWHYMAWTLFPTNESLSLYHDNFRLSTGPFSPWTTLPAVIGLGGLVAGAWGLRRRLPWISFGVLWFLVMHLLVSTVIPLELVWEHRNYLGSLGLVIAVLAALMDKRIPGYAAPRGVAILALIVAFMFVTTLRSHQWGDPLRHAAVEAAERPDSDRANYSYAILLAQRNDDPGSQTFQRAMTLLKALKNTTPSSLAPWSSLIVSHTRHDSLTIDPAWWEEMQRYLARHPLKASDQIALRTLVKARIEGGVEIPADPVLRLLAIAIDKSPENGKLFTMKANLVLNAIEDLDRGYKLLKEATVAAPEDAQVWRNLIAHQVSLGLRRRARHSLDRLEELNGFGSHTAFIQKQRAELAKARHNQ